MADRHRVVFLHLPKHKPININFEDIVYTIQLGKEKKRILDGVSGTFQSGELTAIMGPSGAGKSSLINVLTGFQSSGIEGSIKSNGVVRSNKTGGREMRKESCYIQQDDQLSPLFTVAETMSLAADLKLGHCLSRKSKQLLIDDILDTIGLAACRDTRCERLSGGQRKRLSIALELVDNPPVMFLDEPTTGLDSSSSLQCVSMLKSLARGGRTIVCTIHQPCATLFELFDHVYVVAEGRCIYQGGACNVVPYLKSVGLNCPQYHNPADYLLDVASGEFGNFTQHLAQVAKERSWRAQRTPPASIEGPLTNGARHSLSTMASLADNCNGPVGLGKTSVLITTPSEFTRFWVLLNRCQTQLYRDWTVTHLKCVLHLLVGVLLGLNFIGAGADGAKTISNVGLFMCTAIYLCYTSMMPAVLKFPQELAILKKEQFNNWYRLRTYYAAFILANIPPQVVFCLVYTSVAYLISAQPQDWTTFAMFLAITVLITLVSESFGLLLGTLCNPVNGTFFGAVATAFFLLFSGFMALFNDMSIYMYWVSYLSYLRYGVEGMVRATYGRAQKLLPCPDDLIYCHYADPKIVLKEIGMDRDTYWVDFGMLCLIFVVLRVATFCFLKRKVTMGA